MDHVINAEARARGVAAETVRDDYASAAALNTFVDVQDIAQMVQYGRILL